jgi:glycosyltransferase involved in cell wall biosynthesis
MACRLCDRLIAVTPQIKEKVCWGYGIPVEKIAVILNGVDTERCRPMDRFEARRRLGLSPSAQYIGFVGYFFPWSGLEVLIDSALRILERIPGVRFLIVGSGIWGTHLPGLVEKRGLSECFDFVGTVPWEKVPAYINAFDVAVAPYLAINSSGSSMKIIEYLACGVSVVASRTPNIPETLLVERQGVGISVPPGSPQALADALVDLLNDGQIREEMGVKGRAFVVRERSWEKVARQTVQVMRPLIEGRC